MAGASDDILAAIVDAAAVAAAAEGLSDTSAHRIARAICERLQRDYGTATIYVPARSREARDRAILVGLAAGEPASEIARRVGVHQSTVLRVRQRHQQRRSIAPDGWEL